MSEQQAEQTSSETGSLNAGPSDPQSPAVQSEQVTASAPEISVTESPQIAPDHEAAKADEATKVDTTKVEAPKVEATKVEAPKPDSPPIGKLMIMAPGERSWSGARASGPNNGQPKTEQGSAMLGKRRFAAVAAVVALAMVAGALGGALASVGFGQLVGAAATAPANGAIEASIARIDADILALKAGVEHTAKMSVSQVNKTADRLDKLEKAEAEPAAKLAKLTEAVDKLRAAPAAAAPAAPKDVTGSVAPPPAAAAPAAAAAAAAPKAEVGRLPKVEGWVLTDVGYGGALIENRRGTYEVYAGDTIRGLGRIDAIRKQDGHWVVVPSKGLITSR